MVDSHAGAEQPLEDLSEARCELRALHRPGNRLALLLGGNPGVRQRLRGVECGILREMHDVNGGLTVLHRQFHRLLKWIGGISVAEGYRPACFGNDVHVGVGEVLERICNRVHIAQRCAHE